MSTLARPDGTEREQEGRGSGAESEALVDTSAVLYATTLCPWLNAPGESKQRTLGDGCNACPCGQDGWEQLVAVMDYHDREMIGYEFTRRSQAKEARAHGRSGMPPTVWHAPARRYTGHTERQ